MNMSLQHTDNSTLTSLEIQFNSVIVQIRVVLISNNCADAETIFNNIFQTNQASHQSFRDYSTDTANQAETTVPGKAESSSSSCVFVPKSQTINLSRVSELCTNFGRSACTFFILHSASLFWEFFGFFLASEAKSAQLCEHYVISAEHRQRRFNRSVCLLMQSEAAS